VALAGRGGDDPPLCASSVSESLPQSDIGEAGRCSGSIVSVVATAELRPRASTCDSSRLSRVSGTTVEVAVDSVSAAAFVGDVEEDDTAEATGISPGDGSPHALAVGSTLTTLLSDGGPAFPEYDVFFFIRCLGRMHSASDTASPPTRSLSGNSGPGFLGLPIGRTMGRVGGAAEEVAGAAAEDDAAACGSADDAAGCGSEGMVDGDADTEGSETATVAGDTLEDGTGEIEATRSSVPC
jgi:hypothetical protein